MAENKQANEQTNEQENNQENSQANGQFTPNGAPKLSLGKLLLTSKKKGKAMGLDKKTLVLLDIKEWISSIIFAVVAVLLLINFVVRIITVEGSSMNPTLQDGEKLFVTAYDVRFGSAPAKGDAVICHYPGRTNKWLGIFTVKTDFVKRVVGVPGDTITREHGVTYVNDVAIDPSSLGVRAMNGGSASRISYSYEIDENGNRTYYQSVHEHTEDGRYARNEDGSYIYVENGEPKQVNMTDKTTCNIRFDYTYVLKENEYFVVGDNRYHSHDCRYWNGPDMPYEQTNDAGGHVGPITKDMIVGRVHSVIYPFGDSRRIPNDIDYIDAMDKEKDKE